MNFGRALVRGVRVLKGGAVNGIRVRGVGAALVSLGLLSLPHVGLAAEAEGEHGPGIVNLDFTLLLQAINFIILAAILYKFLFKPLATFMEKRAEGIRHSLDEAKQARDEVVRARAEYEESLRAARQEAAAVRQRMDREMAEERERLMQHSREEAQRLLTQARSEIEQEVRRAKAELRSEAVQLSLTAAERLLQRNLTEEDHRRMAEQYIQELGRTS
ncbi:MAG: F0F1 ATP synthase subunit B [Candidatus Methylomirabilales bacterium]